MHGDLVEGVSTPGDGGARGIDGVCTMCDDSGCMVGTCMCGSVLCCSFFGLAVR